MLSGLVDRILYLVPGVGLTPSELERRKAILNSYASENFSFDIEGVTTGPEAIESYTDEYLSVPDSLRIATKAESSGFSALIIGCFGDPGIEAFRENLTIPVVGPGETSMHFASMLGRKFSIITVLRNVVPSIEDLALKTGIMQRLHSIRVINRSVLSISESSNDVRKDLIKEGKKAIEEGADTLVLGCMSEAFLGFAREMQNELGVSVVDPVSASVKMAEYLVTCGLRHSKVAYPFPPRKQFETERV